MGVVKHFRVIMLDIAGDDEFPSKWPVSLVRQLFGCLENVLPSFKPGHSLGVGGGRDIQILVPFNVFGSEINRERLCELGFQLSICLQFFWQSAESERELRIKGWKEMCSGIRGHDPLGMRVDESGSSYQKLSAP